MLQLISHRPSGSSSDSEGGGALLTSTALSLLSLLDLLGKSDLCCTIGGFSFLVRSGLAALCLSLLSSVRSCIEFAVDSIVLRPQEGLPRLGWKCQVLQCYMLCNHFSPWKIWSEDCIGFPSVMHENNRIWLSHSSVLENNSFFKL